MVGLPKSIIKKYGMTKKAWAVFRGTKNKIQVINNMTRKRKKSGFRGFRIKKHHSKHSKGMGLVGTIVGGVAYGAGRQYASNALAPITAKIPAGQYADNVVMGVLSYLVASGKIPLINKIPMSREIGKAGLVIESAMIGQSIIGGKTATGSHTTLY